MFWLVFLTVQEATELGKKARELKKAADALHQEERSGSKGRKWRKNMKAVEKVCLLKKFYLLKKVRCIIGFMLCFILY